MFRVQQPNVDRAEERQIPAVVRADGEVDVCGTCRQVHQPRAYDVGAALRRHDVPRMQHAGTLAPASAPLVCCGARLLTVAPDRCTVRTAEVHYIEQSLLGINQARSIQVVWLPLRDGVLERKGPCDAQQSLLDLPRPVGVAASGGVGRAQLRPAHLLHLGLGGDSLLRKLGVGSVAKAMLLVRHAMGERWVRGGLTVGPAVAHFRQARWSPRYGRRGQPPSAAQHLLAKGSAQKPRQL
mmetsp:Transcript_1743/g.4936  ORF Transcript_1743/g.4936 Transcript_1743/m.4936 type:complete len:239 (+) Transcript_1743:613-1329(+)